MLETGSRFERDSITDKIAEVFGVEIMRAVERLQEVAKGKTFESLMIFLKEFMARDNIQMSEENFNFLEKMIKENIRELGLDNE